MGYSTKPSKHSDYLCLRKYNSSQYHTSTSAHLSLSPWQLQQDAIPWNNRLAYNLDDHRSTTASQKWSSQHESDRSCCYSEKQKNTFLAAPIWTMRLTLQILTSRLVIRTQSCRYYRTKHKRSLDQEAAATSSPICPRSSKVIVTLDILYPSLKGIRSSAVVCLSMGKT